MAIAALVVSVLALVVSTLAARWAKVAAVAQSDLAAIEAERHRAAGRERQRAVLSVGSEPVGTNSHMLVVHNEGPATARDVTIDLAPRAPGEAPGLLNSRSPRTIPPPARGRRTADPAPRASPRRRSSRPPSGGRITRARRSCASICRSVEIAWVPARGGDYLFPTAVRSQPSLRCTDGNRRCRTATYTWGVWICANTACRRPIVGQVGSSNGEPTDYFPRTAVAAPTSSMTSRTGSPRTRRRPTSVMKSAPTVPQS